MKSLVRFLGVMIIIFLLGGIALVSISWNKVGWRGLGQMIAEVSDGKISFENGISVNVESWGKFGEFINKNVIFNINDNDIFYDGKDIWEGDVKKTKVASLSVEKWCLELGGCEFVVKPSGDRDYYAEYKGKGRSQVYTSGEVLYVKVLNSGAINSEKEDNYFILYVPAKVELEKAEIELGAGKAQITDICAETISIEVGAGELIMEDVELQKVNVQVGAGRCVIAGEVTDKLTAECAMGSMELLLKGEEEDFDYDIETVSGSISVANREYSGLVKEKKIDHDADKKMELECAMGSITVGFE